MEIKSEQGMVLAGEKLAKKILMDGIRVIELVGDVGVGKTTLTKGLARGLGVKESVTSPSFTISKTYAGRDGRMLVHYDFYRLGEPGIMIEDLEEKLADEKNVVVIEWGESVKGVLPEGHLTVLVEYCEDGGRRVEIK